MMAVIAGMACGLLGCVVGAASAAAYLVRGGVCEHCVAREQYEVS